MLSTCDWLTQIEFSGIVWRRACLSLVCTVSWRPDDEVTTTSYHQSATLWPHKHLRDSPGETRHYKTWGCQVRRRFPPLMAPVQPWLRSFLVPITWLLMGWVVGVARFGAVHSPFMAPTDTWLRPFVIFLCIPITARSALRLLVYSSPPFQFVTHHWALPFVFLSCQLQP